MNRVSRRALLVASLAFVWPATATSSIGGDKFVDLQLVLAVDVSRSMDEKEQLVQRDGYVSAFRSAEVIKAIASGPSGRIAVTYIEWSSASYQRVLVPWQLIANEEDSLLFADALAEAPITSDIRTSISSGLAFAASAFLTSGFDSDRRTIDVSGDGPNNDGPWLPPVREAILEQGITINGLPILLNPTVIFAGSGRVSVADYYQDCVIGGPSAFVIPVLNLSDFAPAIQRKLILEIVTVTPEIVPVAFRDLDRPKVDCSLAEGDGALPQSSVHPGATRQ